MPENTANNSQLTSGALSSSKLRQGIIKCMIAFNRNRRKNGGNVKNAGVTYNKHSHKSFIKFK